MPLQSRGWAFVSCSSGAGSGSASAQGPTGSLQFHSSSGTISGSANLIFNTGSSPNRLFLTGALLVKGDITATNYDVVNHTVSYLSSSGDSKFGDTSEDVHQFTGSLLVARAESPDPPILVVTVSSDLRVGILTKAPVANFTLSGSYAINFANTTGDYSVTATDYFILARPTASALTVQLPTAAAGGRGRMIIVKLSGSTAITISASTGESIDGDAYSDIRSNYGSETFVSNGSNAWFIV